MPRRSTVRKAARRAGSTGLRHILKSVGKAYRTGASGRRRRARKSR